MFRHNRLGHLRWCWLLFANASGSPWFQNSTAGLVLLLTVGIYVGIVSLGAGGGKPNSTHIFNIISACLYGIFGVTGFFGGSVINTIGPRYTMMVRMSIDLMISQ